MIMSHSALRARSMDNTFATINMLTAGLAQRAGRSPDDFEVRCFAGAVVGALVQAIEPWMAGDSVEPLPTVIDRALANLERGLPL